MIVRTPRNLVIDARPRGPNGPFAGERVLGRPVLGHLLDLVDPTETRSVAIHARVDEHEALRAVVAPADAPRVRFVTGPPPEDSAILRSDRLYDPARLRRALKAGKDLESAVIWRLDRPRGLDGADDELVRRRTYQPLGRFWALGPARTLARWLRPTPIRPNAVTIAAGGLVLAAAVVVAVAPDSWAARAAVAGSLALALILDTADGHLARLQGTASEFGRWLDANLDEVGDMALHAAIAWSAFGRAANPAWLVLGMAYAMGKYLYVVGSHTGESLEATTEPAAGIESPIGPGGGPIRRVAIALGHADVRWHLWIVLGAVGRLDAALVAYAAYFPARALAGFARKVARHG